MKIFASTTKNVFAVISFCNKMIWHFQTKYGLNLGKDSSQKWRRAPKRSSCCLFDESEIEPIHKASLNYIFVRRTFRKKTFFFLSWIHYIKVRAEKFIGPPIYSRGMWPNVVHFSKYFVVFLAIPPILPSVLQYLNPIHQKVFNSR